MLCRCCRARSNLGRTRSKSGRHPTSGRCSLRLAIAEPGAPMYSVPLKPLPTSPALYARGTAEKSPRLPANCDRREGGGGVVEERATKREENETSGDERRLTKPTNCPLRMSKAVSTTSPMPSAPGQGNLCAPCPTSTARPRKQRARATNLRARNPRAPGHARARKAPHNNGRTGGDQAGLRGTSYSTRCWAWPPGPSMTR